MIVTDKTTSNRQRRLRTLREALGQSFASYTFHEAFGELTLEVPRESLISVSERLRDEDPFNFVQLVDLCGIDYLFYGRDEWETVSSTYKGFSRAVEADVPAHGVTEESRFAVIYHLLSFRHNHRLRLKVLVDAAFPIVDSVIEVWPCANWFEREAFDLYGIMFEGHPDLRRLLTDYGFIGHPFRKDFPLSGEVELRYDAEQTRCVYEPTSIQPRVTVPKVLRHDNRYIGQVNVTEDDHG